MPTTTYTVHGEDAAFALPIKLHTPQTAEDWSREGYRVTAVTEGSEDG